MAVGLVVSAVALNAVLVSRQAAAASGGQIMRLNAGDIHVSVDGSATAPTVVLVHGTAGSTAWWDTIMPTLTRMHRVVRIDLLGHGRSAKPSDGDYSVPGQARLISEVLDRLGVDRAVVVGHSSGGLVATAVAEGSPKMVAGLALINTGPALESAIPRGLISDMIGTPGLGQLLWRFRTDDQIRDGLDTAFVRADSSDQLVSDVRGMTYHAFVTQAKEFATYRAAENVPTRLDRLDVPTLVIFGEDDERWRSSSADAYRRVRGVRVEMLAGIGHTPMIEDSTTTARLLLDFVDQNAAF